MVLSSLQVTKVDVSAHAIWEKAIVKKETMKRQKIGHVTVSVKGLTNITVLYLELHPLANVRITAKQIIKTHKLLANYPIALVLCTLFEKDDY